MSVTLRAVTERPNETARNDRFEFDALAQARNYRRALVAEFRPWLHGGVLEIGAGIGQFTALLRREPAVRCLTCVEPDARSSAELRAVFPDQLLVEGTVADLPSDTRADAVFSVNVLEHIREDREELRRYQEILSRSGGHLCLFVPARPEIYAPIDRDFGHHRRYTRFGLRALLQSAGFAIERLHYFNVVGYFAWWLSFCVLKQRRFNPRSVCFFDRAIFPLVHGLERHLCRPPIGQSLIAVARAGS
jgi:SAM-dependent methyltransferase